MSVTTVRGADPAGASQRERELAAIIASYTDVTDKLKSAHERLSHEVRLLHRQLAHKDRELARKERLAALGEMAAGLAHEIRNPLGGIQLFASLLERDLADRPESRELAVKISKGVCALDGIVGEVLAFGGPGDVILGTVELGLLLAETLDLVAPQQRARQISLCVAEDGCKVSVQASAVHLQRALLNLVFNALDAAPQGGHVWITCRQDRSDDWVHVDVADDGPGVPPELAQRIFDPFYTSKDTGTGLGLAIVHRVAEAHGGSVKVTARQGGGAVFTLSLRHAEPRTSVRADWKQRRGGRRKGGA